MSDHLDHDLLGDFGSFPVYRDNVPKGPHLEETVLHMVGTGPKCDIPKITTEMLCPDCGTHVLTSSSSCGRVECPSCWGTWARRATGRAAARIWAYFSSGESQHHPRHITFELESVAFKDAQKKAEDFGFYGGMIIIHPWRIHPDFKQKSEYLAEIHNMNRYDALRKAGYGMEALVWSPHAHAICYGKGTLQEKDQDEYTYRVLRKLNSHDAVKRVCYYLFSHTFVPQKKNSRVVRYFGSCSPQKFAPTWTGTKSDLLRCPKCSAVVVYPGETFGKSVSDFDSGGWHVVVKIPKDPAKKKPKLTPGVRGNLPNSVIPWAYSLA